jgi:hypothetical protein
MDRADIEKKPQTPFNPCPIILANNAKAVAQMFEGDY